MGVVYITIWVWSVYHIMSVVYITLWVWSVSHCGCSLYHSVSHVSVVCITLWVWYVLYNCVCGMYYIIVGVVS